MQQPRSLAHNAAYRADNLRNNPRLSAVVSALSTG
jgi:hypothetical protein